MVMVIVIAMAINATLLVSVASSMSASSSARWASTAPAWASSLAMVSR
jgi:hypothetical protein